MGVSRTAPQYCSPYCTPPQEEKMAQPLLGGNPDISLQTLNAPSAGPWFGAEIQRFFRIRSQMPGALIFSVLLGGVQKSVCLKARLQIRGVLSQRTRKARQDTVIRDQKGKTKDQEHF